MPCRLDGTGGSIPPEDGRTVFKPSIIATSLLSLVWSLLRGVTCGGSIILTVPVLLLLPLLELWMLLLLSVGGFIAQGATPVMVTGGFTRPLALLLRDETPGCCCCCCLGTTVGILLILTGAAPLRNAASPLSSIVHRCNEEFSGGSQHTIEIEQFKHICRRHRGRLSAKKCTLLGSSFVFRTYLYEVMVGVLKVWKMG